MPVTTRAGSFRASLILALHGSVCLSMARRVLQGLKMLDFPLPEERIPSPPSSLHRFAKISFCQFFGSMTLSAWTTMNSGSPKSDCTFGGPSREAARRSNSVKQVSVLGGLVQCIRCEGIDRARSVERRRPFRLSRRASSDRFLLKALDPENIGNLNVVRAELSGGQDREARDTRGTVSRQRVTSANGTTTSRPPPASRLLVRFAGPITSASTLSKGSPASIRP